MSLCSETTNKTVSNKYHPYAANSKSLGYDMAVDFGDVCDAVSAGIDELFQKKEV